MSIKSTRGTVHVPPSLESFFQETHVPGAIQNHGLVWVTGQTGTLDDGSIPKASADQIRQAFVNVTDCLSAAGATWADVVEIESFTIGLREHGEAMIEIAAEFLSPPFPAWTAVGISELWEEGAMFELKCIAVAGTTEPPVIPGRA